MKNMGITDEQLESMQDSMDSLMEMSNNGEMPNLQELLGNADVSAMLNQEDGILPGDDADDPDKFSQGGAPTFPFNIFGGNNANQTEKIHSQKERAKKKKTQSASILTPIVPILPKGQNQAKWTG